MRESGSPSADASLLPLATLKQHIILISEDASLQQLVQHLQPISTTVVARLMLLSADWERARDRSLRMALPDTVRVIMELPRTRTATGTRNDRRVLDRAVTYI